MKSLGELKDKNGKNVPDPYIIDAEIVYKEELMKMKERKKIEYNNSYDITSTHMHMQIILSSSTLMWQIVGGIRDCG